MTMNFLSKLLGLGPETITLRGDGTFALQIVSVLNYQYNLESICGPRKEKGENRVVLARLVLDDASLYDNQAVRVEIKDLLVGYLSGKTAESYRELLQRRGHPQAVAWCQARIKGGWRDKIGNKGDYELWLDIDLGQ
jgi:hypothetical protein